MLTTTRNRCFQIVLLFLVVSTSDLLGCPGSLFIEELNPRLKGTRDGLRLFVVRDSGKVRSVEPIRLQVDPVDINGRLIFYDDNKWRSESTDKFDLITYRVEEFGARLDYKKDKLPCRGPITFELKDRENPNRYAYITNCKPHKESEIPVYYPVKFDNEKHLLESQTYRYHFNSDNYMQFDEIHFKSKGKWIPMASKSQLLIKADVKNFFDMNFDSDDIESQLEATRLGEVGDLANLSFFLKILFFKIKMSLTTSVVFFEDSGHIPMMVNIPVDSRKYLNEGSGILYSWILSKEANAGHKEILMPVIDVDEIKKGYESLGKSGLKYCKGKTCLFRYKTIVSDQALSMDFEIEKKFVEKGFFPHFVPDVKKYAKKLDWEIDEDEKEHRIGMYFEVSGLDEGGYPWDFWLRLGASGNAENLASKCPHGILHRKIPGGVLK